MLEVRSNLKHFLYAMKLRTIKGGLYGNENFQKGNYNMLSLTFYS